MKLRPLLLPITILLACSTSTNHGAPAGSLDSGMGTADTGPGGAADTAPPVDAAAVYAQAVAASRWSKVPTAPIADTEAKMDDIYFPSATTGYAVNGEASTIYKTSDGGSTWKVSYTHPGTYFRSILFVDDDNGFASNLGAGLSPSISDTNVLYGTKDGGATWTPVTAITGPMPSGICNQTMIDPQHLVATGRVEGPTSVMISSNGGASWTATSLDDQLSMLIDVRFTSPTDGIVIGSSPGNLNTGTPPFYATILHTADAGATWQTVFTSKTALTLGWKISFPSPQVGYVSIQDAGGEGPPSFLKTTDGGMTWVEKPLPTNPSGSYAGIGIGFITESIGWVSADYISSGAPSPTYRTLDGGETWAIDPSLQSPINRFRFLDANNAFAIGGTIWKLAVP